MLLDNEQDLKDLQENLEALAQWEKKMCVIDRDLEIHRIRTTDSHYQLRTRIIEKNPKFWYIVFAENDDLSDYISPDDLKYMESILNIQILHYITSASEPFTAQDLSRCKDFSITFTFSHSGLVPAQTVTKNFRVVMQDGEEKIVSDPVAVEWPAELQDIDPIRIKRENMGKPLTPKLKKDYRTGMRSFFAWFAWTGIKPGKEFRNGEDLVRLIADDLYINALKYYILALPSTNSGSGSDLEEFEGDSSEGEALDLSDSNQAAEYSDNDLTRKRLAEDTDVIQQCKREK